MNKMFDINFLWDTGNISIEKNAFILAENEIEAEEKLQKYVKNLTTGSRIKEIYTIKELKDQVIIYT